MIDIPDVSVLDRHISFFSRFDLSKELVEVAKEIIEDVKERVSGGVSTDGTTMDTKAREQVGRYSKSHAKARTSKGLGTVPRDLFLTGSMVNDYGIIKADKNTVQIGFSSSREADKAEWNEDYMGLKVFDVSDSELDKAINKLDLEISLKINKL